MTGLTEIARAKINLTLSVLGRRPDGYHELESLVAFADCGDVLTLEPDDAFALHVDGPLASAIDGPNLIETCVRLAKAERTDLATGRFTLTKHLPVAAGVGGGSANAAAALRLLARRNPLIAHDIDWRGIGRRVGADVPVCLAQVAQRMRGIGETLAPVGPLPPVGVVLANPRLPLATRDVFEALAAPPFDPATMRAPEPLPRFTDADALFASLEVAANDLEPVARRLCPAVAPLIDQLASLAGARIARMSGSGPTCFALFASRTEADAAARRLEELRPECWVVSATLL